MAHLTIIPGIWEIDYPDDSVAGKIVNAISFTNPDQNSTANKTAAAAKSVVEGMTGIPISDLNKENQELDQLRSSLTNALNQAYNGYKSYAQQVYHETPTMDTSDMEDLVNQLLNQQSEFSRYLSGYAPFATAKKAAQLKYRTISNAVEAAQKKLTATEAANRAIEQANTAGREAADQLNSRLAYETEQANKKVDQLIGSINSQINQVDTMRNISDLGKAQESYKEIKKNVKAEADKLINSAQEYSKE